MPSKSMSLNLDDDQEFGDGIKIRRNLILVILNICPRFVFGHYMKSYLSYYNDQFDNLTIINDKVQEILHMRC